MSLPATIPYSDFLTNQFTSPSTKITSLSTKITHCSTITRSLSTKITHCSTITKSLSTKITHCSTITSSLSTKITHCSTKINSLSTKITHCSTPLRKSRFFCRILSDIRLPSQKSPISSGFSAVNIYIYCRKKINIQHLRHLQHLKIFQHLVGLGVVGVGYFFDTPIYIICNTRKTSRTSRTSRT